MRALFISFLCLLGTLPAHSATHEYTLDNGLKIIVKEDKRAPVVVCTLWYNVGAANEPGGITGISHALEHLMFKGTLKFPQGVFSQKIAALGGQENAFTNYDYTAYFAKIPAKDIATCLELEADRMQNLQISAQEFAKEIKVVQEERRLRTDDNPQALTFERFMATAHLDAPYHSPVVGWMHDLLQMTADDARQWYKKYYTPNNATVVIVGDVSPEEVLALCKKYFSHIASNTTPEKKQHVEPPHLGKKHVNVHAKAQVPMLIMGYTVPSVKAMNDVETPYVLEVIAALLDAGDSGRFSQNLIRGSKIASSVSASYNLYSRFQTQFIIYGMPSNKSAIAELERGILSELKKLKIQPIAESELQRIKNQLIAQKTFERDSIFSQAMELGQLETIGLGHETASKYIERIKKVTPQQIQQVAQAYFNDKRLTVAELISNN